MIRTSKMYLACVLILFIMLTITGFSLMLIKQSYEFYDYNTFYLAQFGLHVFLGIILGFCDRVIFEKKKIGPWRLDVHKLIILGIPMALFACTYLIYFNIHIPGNFNPFNHVVNIETGQVAITQVILGYIVITSIYKGNSTLKVDDIS